MVMKRADIETFYARLEAADPEPVGELNYCNHYTLLVAVVLSAQATDVGVNKATKALFEIVDTPEKMVKLGEKKLVEHIKTIGLYRNKAKNVIGLSERLIADHGSEVPADHDALIKLPGVGSKTANVVLNIAFGVPAIAVDTHIFRVGNRTGLAPGMWCLTSPSVCRRSRSIPIYSGSATAPAWRRERTSISFRNSWKNAPRTGSSYTLIIG